MHGSSSDCNSEMGYAPLIKAGFSVLTPSRPGYGRTPSSVGETAHQAAEAMIGLLDSLRLDKVYLIAISGGGPTGIHLAANHPDRIKAMVLESAVSKRLETYKFLKKYYGGPHSLIWLMTKTTANIVPKLMFRITMSRFSTHDVGDIMKHTSPEDVAVLKQFFQTPDYAHGALIDLEHETTRELLNRIQIPTLVVHSQEDASVAFDHGQYSKDNIETSELYIARTFSHFIWIGPGSDEVGEKVIGFLHQY
jgi:pimeloyl-ACP methyl ester carboxylesterase